MANAAAKFELYAKQLAEESDSDVYAFVGGVNEFAAKQFIDLVGGSEARRTNAYLLLATNGGDPTAAYKISRCLQKAYTDVTVGVYGPCKSAGTLIALSAKQIVMGEHGELGPLDVQLKKDDSLFAFGSGLATAQALESLKDESIKHFEHFLFEFHREANYSISTRLASSVAIRLTVGLLGPVYQQIDPVRLGEVQRAMRVAREYGERLNSKFSNVKPDGLDKLIGGYPAHGFCIDLDEATTLFEQVSAMVGTQLNLASELSPLLLDFNKISAHRAMIAKLSHLDAVELNNSEGVDSDGNEVEDDEGDSNDSAAVGGSGNNGSEDGRSSMQSSKRAIEASSRKPGAGRR